MTFDRSDPGPATGAPDTQTADRMMAQSDAAAALLRALGHGGRLMILCHLVSGERTVSDLERLLQQRQAAVSQQLARLRAEGLVSTRRDGKAIYYSLQDPRVQRLVALLYDMFCDTPG